MTRKSILALTTVLALGSSITLASNASAAHFGGGHSGGGGHFGGGHFGGGHFGGGHIGGGHFGGGHFGGGHFGGNRFGGGYVGVGPRAHAYGIGGHSRHFWHGRWWNYGAGPCWVWSDFYGEYVWQCD